MRVPLLDLSEQYRLLERNRSVARSMRSSRTQSFILGPKVEEFERALADYCGDETRDRRFLRDGCAAGYPDGARDRA